MEISGIPVRVTGASHILYDLYVFEIPGVLFLSAWAAQPTSMMRKLLETQLIGYNTKIALFALIAFLIGFVLLLIGGAVVSASGGAILFLRRRFNVLERAFQPSQLEWHFVLHVFREMERVCGAKVVEKVDLKQEEVGSSILAILLEQYTSSYEDLASTYLRHGRTVRLLISTFAAVVAAIVFGLLPLDWKTGLSALAAYGFALTYYVGFNSLAARLVLAGYFRQQTEKRTGSAAGEKKEPA